MTIKLSEKQKAIWLKWADTLEFGNLKQIGGRLCVAQGSELSYSYLGVLCAMHNADTAPTENHWKTLSQEELRYLAMGGQVRISYMGSESTPPHDVLNWAGFDTYADTNLPISSQFAHLEDNYLKFSEIANVIRECVAQDSYDVAKVAKSLYPKINVSDLANFLAKYSMTKEQEFEKQFPRPPHVHFQYGRYRSTNGHAYEADAEKYQARS